MAPPQNAENENMVKCGGYSPLKNNTINWSRWIRHWRVYYRSTLACQIWLWSVKTGGYNSAKILNLVIFAVFCPARVTRIGVKFGMVHHKFTLACWICSWLAKGVPYRCPENMETMSYDWLGTLVFRSQGLREIPMSHPNGVPNTGGVC